MKLRPLSRDDAAPLILELRAMAERPPGPASGTLRRAREILFQLRGQDWARPEAEAKADRLFEDLEILMSTRRWRDEISIEFLRKRIKSGCVRLAATLGLPGNKAAV